MMLAVNKSDMPQMDAEVAAELPAQQLRSVAVSRDRAAFGQLYRQFAPKIKGYMMRQGADDATADDLAQETMMQLWRKAALDDAGMAAPSSWIFTIGRNPRIDRLRRQKFYEVELIEDYLEAGGATAYTDNAAQRIDAGRLANLLSKLPADQTEVVWMAFFEGLSHVEIANRLDLPLGTVKSRLRLAFGKLRAAMGERK